ncbi:FtsQ-type POTRA domain-containing protein [Slackia exigua]|uniref:cell division protein FtsQ/DivIB n=1 Tax=Slackia exigua TaxID=84109 RepID=UPI0028D19C39|nr:FtsQ-type POTRA domain-containing protein [Slackia exigua]
MDSRRSISDRSSVRSGRSSSRRPQAASRSTRPARRTASSPFGVPSSGSERLHAARAAREGSGLTSMRVGDIRRNDRIRRDQERRRGVARRVVAVLVAIAVFLVAGATAYSSNLFAIEDVSVEGVEHLTSEEMSRLAAIPADTTLLRVDTGKIEANILRDAWIKKAKVSRGFPNTLVISATERPIAATVEVLSEDGSTSELWAIADDGTWLCRIPDQDSAEGRAMSPAIYDDAAHALAITDVAYGLRPEVGSTCTDASVNNALAIVSGMTTELKDQVKQISASSSDNATLTLDSNVEIAFGAAEDIRDKERVCLQILKDNEGSVAYINVRVASSPTWRSV